MRYRPFRAAAVVVVLALIWNAEPDYASAQAFRTTLAQLAEVSESVVIARTVSTESFWNEDRSAILTRVTLRVSDNLQGQAPAETVVVVPGGRVGNFIHEVSDVPVFIEEEESVVFVERHSSGVNVVAGGAMGKLEIREDPVTHVRTISGAASMMFEDQKAGPGENELGPGEKEKLSRRIISLDTFVRRFRNLKGQE